MCAATSLRVGGLSPHSSCDWPGQLVATVFAQGCPWACAYCHNPHLLPARGSEEIAWADVLAFLQTRQRLLDGVVFTGGEPTMQEALLGAVADVRALGFQVGLHTGGQFPDRLARVLPHVDWVGFDVKAPWGEYERVTGIPGSGAVARESLAILVASGVPFEARTTVHPALLSADDLSLARRAAGECRRAQLRAARLPPAGVRDRPACRGPHAREPARRRGGQVRDV